MKTQEAREIPEFRQESAGRDSIWFQPKTLYLLLGMVLLIALMGTFLAPQTKRDANGIVSPFDYSQAPPQVPDRSAVVLSSPQQAKPASQGAGAKTVAKKPMHPNR